MADDHPSDELASREPTASELHPGELQQYSVIRVADEILVDLMGSAGGIDYAEAAKDVVVHDVDGVRIPFASPRLLWRMKVVKRMRRPSRGTDTSRPTLTASRINCDLFLALSVPRALIRAIRSSVSSSNEPVLPGLAAHEVRRA